MCHGAWVRRTAAAPRAPPLRSKWYVETDAPDRGARRSSRSGRGLVGEHALDARGGRVASERLTAHRAHTGPPPGDTAGAGPCVRSGGPGGAAGGTRASSVGIDAGRIEIGRPLENAVSSRTSHVPSPPRQETVAPSRTNSHEFHAHWAGRGDCEFLALRHGSARGSCRRL